MAHSLLARARDALARGDALHAADLLSSAEAPLRHTLAARQLLALALLRAGALEAAGAVLAQLAAQGHEDEETLGLAARLEKARWLSGQPQALGAARAAYLRAFQLTGGSWTGINAASLAVVAGDEASAAGLAGQVLQQLEGAEGGFWSLATRAEALLVLRRQAEAADDYRAAIAAHPRAWGDQQSARLNARLLCEARSADATWADTLFPAPVVAAFAGHMMDAPDRAVQRLPAGGEADAAVAIAQAIEANDIQVGIAGAACGADILFLEALRAAGREFHVVLPHPAEVFRDRSVVAVGGPAWGHRFDSVLASAQEVNVLGPHEGEALSYQFHGEVIAGMARLRANAIGGRALGLAYWDGQPGQLGGTGSVLTQWQRNGIETVVIPCGPHAPLRAHAFPPAEGNSQRIVAILFADAVGFSRMTDPQVRRFSAEFWPRVASVLQQPGQPPALAANTWGDGLFAVLARIPQAADVALQIVEMVQATDWSALDLPADLSLRVGLHAGPAYDVDDPVTGRASFVGMHISRAARIEPVTPAGAVYVSEPFAALLALDDNELRFHCEYAGTLSLAKEKARLRSYRLTRR